MSTLCGYAGQLLRVDLSTGTMRSEALDEATARKWGSIRISQRDFIRFYARLSWRVTLRTV